MLAKLLSFVRKNPLVAHSSVYFIGTMLVNVASYLFHVVMARWLGVEDYGELQSLLSVLIIFNIPLVVVQTVIVNYAARFHGTAAHGQLFLLWRGMTRKLLLLSGLFAAAMVVIAEPVQWFLHLDSPWPVLGIGVSVITSLLVVPNRSVLQGTRRFVSLSTNAAIEMFGKLIVGGGLVLLGWQLTGAIGGIIIGALIAYGHSFFPLWHFWRERHAPEQAATVTARELFRYSGPVFVSLLGLAMLYSTDVILAKHFLTPELAGYYGGLSIVGRIIFFLSAPISAVMFSLASEHSLGSTVTASRPIVRQALLLVGGGAAVAVAGYALFPRLVTQLLLGADFFPIIPLLAPFGLAMSLYSIANLLAHYFLSVHRMGFIWILATGVILQAVALVIWHQSLAQFVWVMNAVMALVLAGFLVYHRQIQTLPSTDSPV